MPSAPLAEVMLLARTTVEGGEGIDQENTGHAVATDRVPLMFTLSDVPPTTNAVTPSAALLLMVLPVIVKNCGGEVALPLLE